MIRSPRDYTAYGISIRSSLALPFVPLLGPPTGEADVVISFGKVPATIQTPIIRGRIWEAPENIFLMNVPGVARYLVTGGRNVTVDPCGGSDMNLGVFLAGTVFVGLLQQRGLTTFHASAIATETRGAVRGPFQHRQIVVARSTAQSWLSHAERRRDGGNVGRGRVTHGAPAAPYLSLHVAACGYAGHGGEHAERRKVREGIEKSMLYWSNGSTLRRCLSTPSIS